MTQQQHYETVQQWEQLHAETLEKFNKGELDYEYVEYLMLHQNLHHDMCIEAMEECQHFESFIEWKAQQ